MNQCKTCAARIIRVFPRRTAATPEDADVRVAVPPGMFDEADEVHVSVAFEWDKPLAEWLAKQWEQVAPVKIGGPAYGDPGGEFVAGMYLKPGNTITSRGCPNHCWFCKTWKDEGPIRELEIKDGYNLRDNNILACSQEHQERYFRCFPGNQKGRDSRADWKRRGSPSITRTGW